LLLPTVVQAANLTIPENATIFAPTNAAFNSSTIKDKTGLSAADLLLPANKDILVKVRPASKACRRVRFCRRAVCAIA
jgi:hypothetical protein